MSDRQPIPVVVNGAAGKMGLEVIKAVANAPDLVLLGAIDRNPKLLGEDIGEIAGCGALEIPVMNDLQAILAMASQEKEPAVMVDFTHPDSIYENVRSAIAYGVRPVVGTTGSNYPQFLDRGNLNAASCHSSCQIF
jgi:4-hydroxy-tetrahydrodipicolinate reductase